jgi:hypothetical protein
MNSLSDELDSNVNQHLEVVEVSPNDLSQNLDFTTMNSVGVDNCCEEMMFLLESPLDDQVKTEAQVVTNGVKHLVPIEESLEGSQ